MPISLKFMPFLSSAKKDFECSVLIDDFQDSEYCILGSEN